MSIEKWSNLGQLKGKKKTENKKKEIQKLKKK